MMRTVAASGLALVSLLGLAACDQAEEVTYVQYNASGELLTIQVGAETLLEPSSIELNSSTGSVVVGTATVDPAGGPVGTEHTVTVEVSDDYENDITRVTVRTDSGDRGEDEYELEGDSADEGFWKLTLVSAGEADEVREDTFTVRLWESSVVSDTAEE